MAYCLKGVRYTTVHATHPSEPIFPFSLQVSLDSWNSAGVKTKQKGPTSENSRRELSEGTALGVEQSSLENSPKVVSYTRHTVVYGIRTGGRGWTSQATNLLLLSFADPTRPSWKVRQSKLFHHEAQVK